MAKSKKRKPNTDTQLKLQAAKSLSEYKRRMKDLLIRLGFEADFKYIERDIDLIHRIRPKSVHVTALDDKVPDYFLEYVRSHVDYSMKELTVQAFDGGPIITHGDLHHLLEPLRIYLRIRQEKIPELSRIFAPILQIPSKTDDIISIELAQRIEMLGVSESNFTERFFHVTTSLGTTSKGGSPRETLHVEVRSEPPTWRQIRIGAGKRNAARMGFSFPKAIEWMRVRPSKLGIRKTENDEPLDVYILQHAAQRLYQRIGGKYNDLMSMDMILSLFDLRAFHTGGGNILIEHRITKIKVGYYVATITDGILLIRTFLLLTHTGTPEGRKLTTLTGLSKWDHKYMAFDSLPALAASDLLQNEETRKIFVRAGCEGLITICERMIERSEHYHISDKPNIVADKLLQYIKQGKEETSDLWETDPETTETPAPSPKLIPKIHTSISIIPQTPTLTPQTPSPNPQTPSPTPQTPNPNPQTPTLTPQTPTLTPQTPNLTPQTPNLTPQTPSLTPQPPTPIPQTPSPIPQPLLETDSTFIENISSLSGNENAASGNINTLLGNIATLSETENPLFGKFATFLGNIATLSGNSDPLSENNEALSGNNSSHSENIDTFSETDPTLSGNSEALFGNDPTLSENIETLSGNIDAQ